METIIGGNSCNNIRGNNKKSALIHPTLGQIMRIVLFQARLHDRINICLNPIHTLSRINSTDYQELLKDNQPDCRSIHCIHCIHNNPPHYNGLTYTSTLLSPYSVKIIAKYLKIDYGRSKNK